MLRILQMSKKYERSYIAEHVLTFAHGKMLGGFVDIAWLHACYVGRAVVPAMSAKPPGIFPRVYVSTCSVIGPPTILNIYKILSITTLYALKTVSAS